MVNAIYNESLNIYHKSISGFKLILIFISALSFIIFLFSGYIHFSLNNHEFYIFNLYLCSGTVLNFCLLIVLFQNFNQRIKYTKFLKPLNFKLTDKIPLQDFYNAAINYHYPNGSQELISFLQHQCSYKFKNHEVKISKLLSYNDSLDYHNTLTSLFRNVKCYEQIKKFTSVSI